MKLHIADSTASMAQAAANTAAAAIIQAITNQGRASISVATGASQFEFLQHLVENPAIEWGKITAFHLDEYVGLPISHKASFRKYLRERFLATLPSPLAQFVEVNGEAADLDAECNRLHQLLQQHPLDLACIGIGENAHLAFNDPPADFDTSAAYHVVDLDQACRQQQVGEGWFATLNDVPERAISMSIPQIMRSKCIVCTVPDKRKAIAVKNSVEGEITNLCPASILQQHTACTIFLDPDSASLLSK